MINIDLRYFEDAWIGVLQAATITNITPAQIAWPDKTFVPKKGVPYLKPELASRTRRPVGVGADSVQEWTGIYQIGIYTPRDSGTRLQNEIASAVLAAFPRGLSQQTPQGIWMTVTSSTAPQSVPFGDWVSLPVQVAWFAHEPP